MSIFVSHQTTTHCDTLCLSKCSDSALFMLFSIKSKHQINPNFFPWFFWWWLKHIFDILSIQIFPFKLHGHHNHSITPWKHCPLSVSVWLLLQTLTGAHWHPVTSRGRSRRWGGLRLRAPRCHNLERDGGCVRQIRTPQLRYLSLDSYPRVDITHFTLHSYYKTEQDCLVVLSLMLLAFS